MWLTVAGCLLVVVTAVVVVVVLAVANVKLAYESHAAIVLCSGFVCLAINNEKHTKTR